MLFNRYNAIQKLASDVTQSILRATLGLGTLFNDPVEILKSKTHRASFVEVALFSAKTRPTIIHSYKITLQNKIFEDFGFAQSSITLEILRIFIEVPDFVDTSISTLLLQAIPYFRCDLQIVEFTLVTVESGRALKGAP